MRIGLIHALRESVAPINASFARIWPEAVLANMLDDSLSADLARGASLDSMTWRFLTLARYARDSGADGILFTCSAFGPCLAEVAHELAGMPVLRPNEAMLEEAARYAHVGLVASFGPSLVSMPPEFDKKVSTALAEGALAALSAGDGDTHDRLAAEAAATLTGCDAIALAQFSLARAADAVAAATGLPVLTTPDSSVRKLRALLDDLNTRRRQMMDGFDLVVRGGTVVTAQESFRADIGIIDGRIATIGANLTGTETLDAGGLLVMPGGVDTHCHIEQLQPGGLADEETWTTGSTACLAGGTTSVVTFSTQFKGSGILEPLAEYHRRAKAAMVDYGFHQIITDASDDVIMTEIPQIVAAGVRSLKVFLTYDPLHLDDRAFIRVLAAARRAGALVTVHCENYEAINWRTEALLAAGMTAAKYHAWSRPSMIEREAAHRAIALAEMVDQPIQIFHVSCSEVAAEIAAAQFRGLKVWGETCPQYFVLTAEDMDRPGFEGAKFMCSPAPRGTAEQAALWEDIRRGTLDIISSDHSGWCYDGPRGKRVNGDHVPFRDIPNGVPGLAARLPIIFSEGVSKGRIDASQFVRLVAGNPARLFGLAGKGAIAPGYDADLVLWDPAKKVTLTNSLMQHIIDYTPYEGLEVTGWPVATLLRGKVAMRDGHVQAEPGSGRFLARAPYDMIRPRGVLPNGFDASAYA